MGVDFVYDEERLGCLPTTLLASWHLPHVRMGMMFTSNSVWTSPPQYSVVILLPSIDLSLQPLPKQAP